MAQRPVVDLFPWRVQSRLGRCGRTIVRRTRTPDSGGWDESHVAALNERSGSPALGRSPCIRALQLFECWPGRVIWTTPPCWNNSGSLVERLARRSFPLRRVAAPTHDLWSAGAIRPDRSQPRFRSQSGSLLCHPCRARAGAPGAMLDEFAPDWTTCPRRNCATRTDDLVKTRKKLAGTWAVKPPRGRSGQRTGGGRGGGQRHWPPCWSRRCDSNPSCHPGIRRSHRHGLAARRGGPPLDRSHRKAGPSVCACPVVALHRGISPIREIAGMLEVSEPRVCQLHSEGAGLLRKLLVER